jgi:hypothetical protein
MIGFVLLAALIGCGGGDDSASKQDNDGTSKVALFLADGPADAFDHIWIEVSRISLQSGDGTSAVIYETDDPTRIDLLTLQEDDLLLAVNGSVPAGAYHKIRMTVERVEGEQEGQPVAFHLASNKIDLNPRNTIDVTPGETLALRLDIDADKSIHVAGPNYNFRPVVFVDSGPMQDPHNCDHMIQGEITELLYAESGDETVIGFRIKPFQGMAELDIYFEEKVVIFDDNGLPAGPEVLAVEQMVSISGELATDGRLLADIVIIGEVQTLTGVVESAVADNQFTLNTGLHWDDLWFTSDTIPPEDDVMTVTLSDGTLIRMGDTEVGADQILPGRNARIVGKMTDDSTTMNAIAVFLKVRQIVGKLTNIEAAEGGSLLTIEAFMDYPHVDLPNIEACHSGEGEVITVFLPDSAPMDVKGGGDLTLDELKALVACQAPRVQVQVGEAVEPDETTQGSALVVWPQTVKMRVDQIDPDGRIITAGSGATLHVAEGTPIWLHDEEEQTPVEFGDIESGDVLLVAALMVCEPTDYEAVVIVQLPGCQPPDDICIPYFKRVELTVDKVDGTTIVGEDGASVQVTETTHYLDRTQLPPKEMTLENIASGDTLVCIVLRPCDDDQETAIMVIRVNPGGDEPGPTPDPDHCHPGLTKMRATVESVTDSAIMTTEGLTIQVPAETSILAIGKNGVEKLSLSDLAIDDQLEILASQTCGEEPDITALLIIKQVDAGSDTEIIKTGLL